MRNESFVFDQEIVYLEVEMEKFGKHLISTDTLMQRALPHFEIEAGTDSTEYFTDVGVRQVMQTRLYAHGYRSVRRGYFVNLDRCDSYEYLTALLESSETDVKTRAAVMEKIKEKKDGQTSIDFSNGTVHVPMNEEQFMQKIKADAI